MKKLSVICCFAVIGLILGGCSSTKETKEVKVIHEHHIYVHNIDRNMMRRSMPGQRPNQKFGQSKGGIDPRYDHKPGQGRPNRKLGNPGRGIDPRYDHKTGAAPKSSEK